MTAYTRLVRAAACVTLVTFLLPGAAVAAEQSAARKLGRGLAAMTCGFLEIPGNIVEVSRERGQGWGFTLGFAQGLGKTVVRVLVGVYETVTAPIEVPKGFAPIIKPEFPWDYFEAKK
jgi:putative exosortase-associated protein (TIGR04073 family)